MFPTRTERNVRKLTSSLEGRQALEDTLARWIEVNGRLPDPEELEVITTVLCRARSRFHMILMNALFLIIGATVVSSCIREVIIPVLQ